MDQDLEFLDYIESSSKALQSLEDKNNELQTKLAELKEEKVILEKVASQSTFDSEKLHSALQTLASQNVIDSDYVEKVASLVEESPNKILDLLTKIASKPHTYGTSIEKEEISSEEDPDGWGSLTRANRY